MTHVAKEQIVGWGLSTDPDGDLMGFLRVSAEAAKPFHEAGAAIDFDVPVPRDPADEPTHAALREAHQRNALVVDSIEAIEGGDVRVHFVAIPAERAA